MRITGLRIPLQDEVFIEHVSPSKGSELAAGSLFKGSVLCESAVKGEQVGSPEVCSEVWLSGPSELCLTCASGLGTVAGRKCGTEAKQRQPETKKSHFTVPTKTFNTCFALTVLVVCCLGWRPSYAAALVALPSIWD